MKLDVVDDSSANKGTTGFSCGDICLFFCYPCILCFKAFRKTFSDASAWRKITGLQVNTLRIYLKEKEQLLKINTIFGYTYGPLFHNNKLPKRKDVLQRVYYYNAFDYANPVKNVGNILPF
jgi:hypothetical protein